MALKRELKEGEVVWLSTEINNFKQALSVYLFDMVHFLSLLPYDFVVS